MTTGTHFGDPFSEQRLLADGQGWVALDRDVLELTGSDRLSWLDTLSSHRIEPDASSHALILDPHGHVEHELHVVDHKGATWLIVAPGTGRALAAYLDSMRFFSDVTVRVADDHDVVWVPRREQFEDLPTWQVPPEYAGLGSTPSGQDKGGTADKYVPQRPGRLVGAEVVVAAGQRPEGRECGTWALEALRVAAGVPRMGADTDHRSLPHELGWIGPAVHLAKGCYRGQETVARLHNMGRPPRRLVLLHFDGALPQAGSEVQLDGRVVGRVGSVAQHHELGPIGLAVVKRSTPLDAPVYAEGIVASQEQVVAG